MQTNRLNDVILASGAVGLLLLAFIVDTVLRGLGASMTSNSVELNSRVVFMIPLFELLFMAAVVGLIWMMVANRGYARWVSAVYLVVGVAILYAFAMYYVALLPEGMSWIMLYMTPDTFVYQAAGAAAALGLISLWFWRGPEKPAAVVSLETPEAAQNEEELDAD